MNAIPHLLHGSTAIARALHRCRHRNHRELLLQIGHTQANWLFTAAGVHQERVRALVCLQLRSSNKKFGISVRSGKVEFEFEATEYEFELVAFQQHGTGTFTLISGNVHLILLSLL